MWAWFALDSGLKSDFFECVKAIESCHGCVLQKDFMGFGAHSWVFRHQRPVGWMGALVLI